VSAGHGPGSRGQRGPRTTATLTRCSCRHMRRENERSSGVGAEVYGIGAGYLAGIRAAAARRSPPSQPRLLLSATRELASPPTNSASLSDMQEFVMLLGACPTSTYRRREDVTEPTNYTRLSEEIFR